MGVGAGIFRMTNQSINPSSSVRLTAKELSLTKAYAQSVDQDKLIATEFEAVLADGLVDECLLSCAKDGDTKTA